MGSKPIANKYREGKMKRTLKRELKSTWNCWKGKRMEPVYGLCKISAVLRWFCDGRSGDPNGLRSCPAGSLPLPIALLAGDASSSVWIVGLKAAWEGSFAPRRSFCRRVALRMELGTGPRNDAIECLFGSVCSVPSAVACGTKRVQCTRTASGRRGPDFVPCAQLDWVGHWLNGFHSTRLETRTKESNICASLWVTETPDAQWKWKVGLRSAEVENLALCVGGAASTDRILLLGRFEYEHICWDPKDGELCLNRVKPGETLVEARSDTDVQIVRHTFGYRGERLIEPSSSWFPPKFPSG